MSTSFSFKLKSHPDKLLYEHLNNVANISKNIILSKKIKNKEIFSEIAYLIGISHDFAKSTTYFQDVLEERIKRTENAYHGFLSSIFGYYNIKKYLEKNNLMEFWYLAPISWIVILKHHGDIKNLRGAEGEIERLNEDIEIAKRQINDIIKNNLKEIKEVYKKLDASIVVEDFFKEFENMIKKIDSDIRKLRRNIEYYFLILFFYSVLLDADKLDASNITNLPKRQEIPSDIVDKYKKLKFRSTENSSINSLRNDAYKEVISNLNIMDLTKDRILSIELPTGCGKTLIALSFALKLREKVKNKLGFVPRIIYSLPFLSIIDQNAEIFYEVLSLFNKNVPSNLLLKHHHLSDIEYKIGIDGEFECLDIGKSLILTEGWHSEIVITTFVQFFHSLITNKNRAARKFHNIINSIIILDEIQSIPYKYWSLLNHVLKYLAYNFNCWIILMTATQPLIFRNGEITPLIKNKEYYFSKFNRMEYILDLREIDFENFKEKILNEILLNKKDTMIVLNTIHSAKDLYLHIKNKLEQTYGKAKIDKEGIGHFPSLELINLSTHILPEHRLKRIEKIKKSKKRKVIITTQLIEAGVDIDIDIIYRDLAPLDCIVQTAGRCNRNNKKEKGILKVINLKKNNKFLYSFIYNPILVEATKELINNKNKIEEKEFNFNLVPKYYETVLKRGAQERSILLYLENLRFSDIREFRLIEEKGYIIDIFIEINENAKKVREHIEQIIETKKGFEKRNELLKLKKEKNRYTISPRVKEETLDKIVSLPKITEGLYYIPIGKIKSWYMMDIGFSPTEDPDFEMRCL
ncbi:hypothetical protein DRN58_05025 [Thermococci archaeon]|nr:MAG: hypothetical protein DRN58_05025 [Thermococci archaeon]